jgi:MFS_1 like family
VACVRTPRWSAIASGDLPCEAKHNTIFSCGPSPVETAQFPAGLRKPKQRALRSRPSALQPLGISARRRSIFAILVWSDRSRAPPALVLGSHAMYDSFAVIRWTQAGISPPTTGVLWSESVAAEILVFLFLGPKLLRVIGPTVALAVAASCGVLRWAVIAQTADVAALALVQPLHVPIPCREFWPPPRRQSTVSSASGVPPPF